jgi:hypothetical protein
MSAPGASSHRKLHLLFPWCLVGHVLSSPPSRRKERTLKRRRKARIAVRLPLLDWSALEHTPPCWNRSLATASMPRSSARRAGMRKMGARDPTEAVHTTCHLTVAAQVGQVQILSPPRQGVHPGRMTNSMRRLHATPLRKLPFGASEHPRSEGAARAHVDAHVGGGDLDDLCADRLEPQALRGLVPTISPGLRGMRSAYR